MRSKLKPWVIPLCIAILVVSIIAILPSNLTGGNLECSDLTKCKGTAGCGSPGEVNLCVLTCSGGGVVHCDDAVPIE